MDELLGQVVMEFGVLLFKSVGLLKDKGNIFFKMGVVPLAYFHYKIALKFLLLMGTPINYDKPSATCLALSLFLNLAACDLKTPDYEQVSWYCTLILYVDPSNVKALYRRGLAFKHLNILPKAVADFECALKINPHNKDISREL
ncbi:70 kDa peptidyl-prolyl isomerase-like [Silene latifolia]|uniref:70 kDa peptidyl-prolyl isomerase-like n=1 Tax=Silene latifolia TaxID=37657 RepID=UPI003D781305